MKFLVLLAFLVAAVCAFPTSEVSENNQNDQVQLDLAALEPNNEELADSDNERVKRHRGYGGYGGYGGGYGGYGGGYGGYGGGGYGGYGGHGGYGGYGGHRGHHHGGWGR